MAMNVRTDDDDEGAISDINVIPLADTMLVMLIIFLVTVPVIIQTVPVQLPSVRFEPTTTKPENVNLSVRGGPGGTCEEHKTRLLPCMKADHTGVRRLRRTRHF